jgi:hypothetical protein
VVFAGPDTYGEVALLDETAVREPAWQTASRRLFVEYARRRAAFLAIGEVVGRVCWDGRSTSYDGREQDTFSLSRRGERWLGLTPYPVWWSWYGDIYRPLVESHLGPGDVSVYPTGLLHQASPDPRRRKRLTDTLPAELRAVQRGRYKLAPAQVIPAALCD